MNEPYHASEHPFLSSATTRVMGIDSWVRGMVGYGYDTAGRLDSLTRGVAQRQVTAIAAVGCWPGYYTVTATMAHVDPVVVHLTINGETIETTPVHPFYEQETAPWLAIGATEGHWTPAGELQAGDQIQQSDGR